MDTSRGECFRCRVEAAEGLCRGRLRSQARHLCQGLVPLIVPTAAHFSIDGNTVPTPSDQMEVICLSEGKREEPGGR